MLQDIKLAPGEKSCVSAKRIPAFQPGLTFVMQRASYSNHYTEISHSVKSVIQKSCQRSHRNVSNLSRRI